MKTLTADTLESLLMLNNMSSQAFNLIKKVKEIKVGEAILYNRRDWKLKTAFPVYISNMRRNRKLSVGFKVKTLNNNKGWVVIRTK